MRFNSIEPAGQVVVGRHARLGTKFQYGPLPERFDALM